MSESQTTRAYQITAISEQTKYDVNPSSSNYLLHYLLSIKNPNQGGSTKPKPKPKPDKLNLICPQGTKATENSKGGIANSKDQRGIQYPPSQIPRHTD